MGLEYLQSITIAMLCHLKWHILTLPTYTQSQIQKLILNDLGKWVMRVLLFDVYLRRKLKRKDLQDRRRWTHTFIVNLWQLITCSHDNTCQMSDSNLVIWVTVSLRTTCPLQDLLRFANMRKQIHIQTISETIKALEVNTNWQKRENNSWREFIWIWCLNRKNTNL